MGFFRGKKKPMRTVSIPSASVDTRTSSSPKKMKGDAPLDKKKKKNKKKSALELDAAAQNKDSPRTSRRKVFRGASRNETRKEQEPSTPATEESATTFNRSVLGSLEIDTSHDSYFEVVTEESKKALALQREMIRRELFQESSSSTSTSPPSPRKQDKNENDEDVVVLRRPAHSIKRAAASYSQEVTSEGIILDADESFSDLVKLSRFASAPSGGQQQEQDHLNMSRQSSEPVDLDDSVVSGSSSFFSEEKSSPTGRNTSTRPMDLDDTVGPDDEDLPTRPPSKPVTLGGESLELSEIVEDSMDVSKEAAAVGVSAQMIDDSTLLEVSEDKPDLMDQVMDRACGPVVVEEVNNQSGNELSYTYSTQNSSFVSSPGQASRQSNTSNSPQGIEEKKDETLLEKEAKRSSPSKSTSGAKEDEGITTESLENSFMEEFGSSWVSSNPFRKDKDQPTSFRPSQAARKLLDAFRCSEDTTMGGAITKPLRAMDMFYDGMCQPIEVEEWNRPYYDEKFAREFLQAMMSHGIHILHLLPPGSQDNRSLDWKGRTVNMVIEPGTTGNEQDIQPTLEWTTVAGGQTFETSTISVPLLSIHSILSSIEQEDESKEYEPTDACFFTITTNKGDVHIFEANTTDDRDRIVNGLRNVIARLAFHLIAGDATASSELYSDESHKEEEVEPGELPPLPKPHQTMNRIAHIMLD